MSTLAQEAKLLQQLQKYPFVPRLYASTNKLAVPGGASCPGIVMQILGPNVTQVRKAQPGGKFRASTACHIGLQMLTALEAIHREGFIHRDVKPSNFVVGYEANIGNSAAASTAGEDTCRPSQCLFVLDYCLCRQHASRDTAAHKPSSGRTAEFRGTSMYASLHSHSGKELTRRDDLWSLMYVVADLVLGGAPWRKASRVRLECERHKRFFFKNPQRLFAPLAPDVARPLLLWHEHLKALSTESLPDYSLIARCLSAAADAAGRLEAAGVPTRPLGGVEDGSPPPSPVPSSKVTTSTGDDPMRSAASTAAPVFLAARKEGMACPPPAQWETPPQPAVANSSSTQAATADNGSGIAAPSTPSVVQSTFDSASGGGGAAPPATHDAEHSPVPPPTIGQLPPGYFDLRRMRLAADEALVSRGGQWQPPGWALTRPDGGKVKPGDAAGLCEANPPAVEARGWGCTGMQLGVTDASGCPMVLRHLHAAGPSMPPPSTAPTACVGQLPKQLLKYARACAALLAMHAGAQVRVDEASGQVTVQTPAGGAAAPQLLGPDCDGRGPLPSYVAPPCQPAQDESAASTAQTAAAPPQQTAEEIAHAAACEVARVALQALQTGEAPAHQRYVAAVDAVMAAHRGALTLPRVSAEALAAFKALASFAPAASMYSEWVQGALQAGPEGGAPTHEESTALIMGALLRYGEVRAALRVLNKLPVEAPKPMPGGGASAQPARRASFGAFGVTPSTGSTPGNVGSSPTGSQADSGDDAETGDVDLTVGDGAEGGSDADSDDASDAEGGPASAEGGKAPVADAVAKAEASAARRAAVLRAASFLQRRVMMSGQPVEAAAVPYTHAEASACVWMDTASPLLKARMLLRQLHLQSTPSAPDTLAAEAASAVPHTNESPLPSTGVLPELTGQRLHRIPPTPPAGIANRAPEGPSAPPLPPSMPPPPSTPPVPRLSPNVGPSATGGWHQAAGNANMARGAAPTAVPARWREHDSRPPSGPSDGRGGYARGGDGHRAHTQPRDGWRDSGRHPSAERASSRDGGYTGRAGHDGEVRGQHGYGRDRSGDAPQYRQGDRGGSNQYGRGDRGGYTPYGHEAGRGGGRGSFGGHGGGPPPQADRGRGGYQGGQRGRFEQDRREGYSGDGHRYSAGNAGGSRPNARPQGGHGGSPARRQYGHHQR